MAELSRHRRSRFWQISLMAARRNLRLCLPTMRFRRSDGELKPEANPVSSPWPDDSWGMIMPKLSGTLTLSPTTQLSASPDDLIYVEEIGSGAYGRVDRMRHSHGYEMAVKSVRIIPNEKSQRLLARELEVVRRNSKYDNFSKCPYIVTYYGTLFQEHYCYICMEIMDTSLDKLYQRGVRKGLYMPESVLIQLAYSIVKALDYLKTKCNMIHRDIKPENILLNKKGQIKMCDFGVAGDLINSVAYSWDAGSILYRSPERISILNSGNGYDVRADVWSVGITLIEVSLGRYPYELSKLAFRQLTLIADPAYAPRLQESDGFSDEYRNFVNECLIFNYELRPTFAELLETPLLSEMQVDTECVREFFEQVLHPTMPTVTEEIDEFLMVD